MKNNKQTAHTPKELLGELQGIAGEAQTILAGSLSEHSVKVFGDLRTRFDAVHDRFAETCAETRKKIVAGARCTDETIRANPYQSLAIAAGIGLLVGVFVSRRGN
jgi:ElaB/YqjD/DUF883 family membrane-anchored ribosome-binding protein